MQFLFIMLSLPSPLMNRINDLQITYAVFLHLRNRVVLVGNCFLISLSEGRSLKVDIKTSAKRE